MAFLSLSIKSFGEIIERYLQTFRGTCKPSNNSYKWFRVLKCYFHIPCLVPLLSCFGITTIITSILRDFFVGISVILSIIDNEQKCDVRAPYVKKYGYTRTSQGGVLELLPTRLLTCSYLF